MDLKSGRTLWTQQNQHQRRYPKLRGNVACDVAIVGAGITGALVAHELTKSGCKVVVIDKRSPVTGSTSASTALLLYETDTSLAELTRRHGWTAAVRAYVLGRRAIREIGAIVRALHIDCGFQSKKSLYLASNRRGLANLQQEYRLRCRAGLPVSFLNSRELRTQFGLTHAGALYSAGAAQLDAVRFAQQLLGLHYRQRRLRIFEKTQILRMESEVSRVRLHTPSGHTVEARHVVIATGYETADFLDEPNVRLHSSYVVASQPLRVTLPWKEGCLIWETARPYLYLRTTADQRVLIGGGDEPFADPRRRDAKLAAKRRMLVEEFRKLFPGIEFVPEFAWTGTFG